MEKGFIFFPESKVISNPGELGIPFEDLTISTEDGVDLNAWFVPFKKSRKTLLWFHGNAGNIGDRVDYLQLLHRKLKLNILIIDYRGYGRSGGEVSEEGTYRDARAAYDYLLTRTDIDTSRIIFLGRSLGAAIAVDLATHILPLGLILEAPFTSIKEMAGVVLPWLPVGRFLATKYDSLSKIDRIQIPLLIMHGDHDSVVPYRQGEKLFDAANEPKQFFTIEGADHNDSYIVGGDAYFKRMSRFIDRLESSAPLLRQH